MMKLLTNVSRHWRRLGQLGPLANLSILYGASPSSQLVQATARREWRLISLNLISSLLEACSEGATFGIIFLAVELLTGTNGLSWHTKPVLSGLPWLTNWLDQINPTSLFLALIFSAVILQAFQSFTRYITALTTGYFGARVYSDITARVHRQILALSFACASRYRIGDLLNTSNTGPRAVELQIQQIGMLVVNILLIISYLTILLSLSPWLLVAAFILGAIITTIQKRLLPKIRESSYQRADLNVTISTKVTEDIQGLRVLHTSGMADQASDDLAHNIQRLEGVLRRQTRLLELISPISSFLPIAGIALIASLSLVVFGSKSTGVMPSLVTFVLALQRLNVRLSMISQNTNSLASNVGNLERLDIVLRSDDKDFRRRGGKKYCGFSRSIVLKNVSLKYAKELPAALTNINLEIPKGKTVALVGSSGSGKSSLADLLVGLYDPSSGEIMIDDIPLQELDPISWQKRLGVVSQDTFLFNTTLANNIAFGCPDIPLQQIEWAARLAQADHFIQALPAGYATLVGERGYRLSGGQRQRISLARAILRNPDLLILDEATSALDSRNEHLVQAAIEQFEKDHTVLVIAHRLSTIVNADLICVMDSGRIVEQGDHSSLLAKRGVYWYLWQQQVTAGNKSLSISEADSLSQATTVHRGE